MYDVIDQLLDTDLEFEQFFVISESKAKSSIALQTAEVTTNYSHKLTNTCIVNVKQKK